MQIYKRKAFLNGLIYLLSSIIRQLINLFLIPIYTRNLSQAQFGQYDLINSFQQLLSIGITLGIIAGMVRLFYEFESKEDLKNNIITFFLFWGGICIIITYFITPSISRYMLGNDINTSKYIYLVVITSILLCIITTYETYFTMQFKAIKSCFINLGIMVLSFTLALYFVIRLQRGILGILEVQFYSALVVCILLLILDIRTLRLRIDMEKFKKVMKYGIGVSPGQLSEWVLNLIDRYFIRGMISLQAVGLYSMGYRIGMLINPVFIVPFIKVINPYKFSVYKNENGIAEVKKLFNYYNFIGWFCILGLGLFAKFVIRMLSTQEYISAFIIVPLVAFSYYLWGMGAFYAFGLEIVKKVFKSSKIIIFAAVINIVFNLLLIPLFGMYGAALSTIISYFTANILYFFVSRKYYDLGFSLIAPYKFGGLALAIYGLYLISTRFINSTLLELALNTIFCIAYIFLSVALGLIPKDIFKKAKYLLKTKFKISEKQYNMV